MNDIKIKWLKLRKYKLHNYSSEAYWSIMAKNSSFIALLISVFFISSCGRKSTFIKQRNDAATTTTSKGSDAPSNKNNNKDESEDQEEDIIAEVPVVISGANLVCHSTKSDSEADAKLTCKYIGSPEELKEAIKNDTLVIVTSDYMQIKLTVGTLDESLSTITFAISMSDHQKLVEEVKDGSSEPLDILSEEEAAAIILREETSNEPSPISLEDQQGAPVIEEQPASEEPAADEEQASAEEPAQAEETTSQDYDPAIWEVAGSGIEFASGTMQCSDISENEYSNFMSKSTYDFSNGSMQIDLVNVVTISEIASQPLIWGLKIDNGNSAHFLIEGDTIIARHWNGGGYINVASRTFAGETDKFLKISHNGAGDIVFEVSADGANWNVFANTPSIWSVTNLTFELSCGAWGAYAGNFSSTVDNFRIFLPEDSRFVGPPPPQGDIFSEF